jgi:uncharacterized protein (DUF58 family)
VFGLSYRFYRLVSGLRYSLPRRFTAAGGLAVAGFFASGAISVNMEQTVAFHGFALIICLLVVAMSASLFFRGRFSVQRFLPRFGTVEQPLSYLVTVRNRNGHRLQHLELLENLADPRPSRAEFAAHQRESLRRTLRLKVTPAPPLDLRQALTRPAALPALPPGGRSDARVELLPLRRGPLRFTGVMVARTDPFGWFRGFVRVPLPQSVLILPKRYPLPRLTLPGTKEYQPGGVALAAAIGDSEEFLSLRHALVLDTFARTGMDMAFEEAVSIAASFAYTVNTQESLLDLLFVGPQTVCFTTGRGLGQAEQGLEVLASVQACRERPFSSLHHLVLRHARAVCGCILVLLDWDEPRRELVRHLRALGRPLLILVVAETRRAESVRRSVAPEDVADVQVLEVGKIPEGLQQLEGRMR